jgi:hypothetical protein
MDLPFALPTVPESSLEFGDFCSLRLSFAEHLGCSIAGRREFTRLPFGQFPQGRPLTSQVFASPGDLVLQFEQLAALVFEMTRQLPFLLRECRLSFLHSQFAVEDGGLLGDEGRGLNPQRFNGRIVRRRRVHARPLRGRIAQYRIGQER